MTTPVRRDNGVTADDWVRVARPLPAVADASLEALRRTGIGAFVTAPVGAGAAGVPDRVELWVDAHELDDVATVLASVRRHAGRSDDDLGLVGEEYALADLGLDDDVLDPDRAPDDLSGLPDAPDDDVDPRGTRNPTPSARPYPAPTHLPARDAGPVGPTRASGRGADHDPHGDLDDPHDPDDDEPDDPDDHFRPEDPEPLRALSRTTVWALAILAAGVVLLALSGLAPTLVGAYSGLMSMLGTAAVLVGTGMLVTRLRDGRRDDGDGNDGGPNGDGAIL